MNMIVKKVTDDSWIFQTSCDYGYDTFDEEDEEEEIPLKLPKDVAKLGKKGMEISCMGLQCRRHV